MRIVGSARSVLACRGAPAQRECGEDRISIGVTRIQTRARYQGESKRTAAVWLRVCDRPHVQEQRALDAHETQGAEDCRQTLDRLPSRVLSVCNAISDVVPDRFDVVDMLGLERIE